jgi:nicotinamide riboside transporter PnuC
MNLYVLEWAASLSGLVGAILLALNVQISRWGWVLFLFSNVLFIAFAVQTGLHGILLMQLGFMATSLLGIYRYWIQVPRISAKT